MLITEVGTKTLNVELNRFLNGSKLSLSQVAQRLAVSKGHLSEIKNGKATPALNTGLRILKICGLSLEERRAWAHFYNKTISDEYLEVFQEVERKNSQKLNEKVSFLLARDLNLMNAYIDIVNEEADLPLVNLRVEYGKSIENKLDKLVAEDILEKKTTELGKVYCTGKVDPVITKNSSYDLLREVVDDQQLKFQAGDLDGSFKFHINDISEEGREELINLLSDTMKKAEKIMEDHKSKKDNGGKRVIFEVLTGSLKTLVFIFFFGLMALSSNIQAQPTGGLTGGSDRILIEGQVRSMPWKEIEMDRSFKINWPEIYFFGDYIKLNNLCYFQYENKLKTIEPIKSCRSTKLFTKDCWIVPYYGNQVCVPHIQGEPVNGHILSVRECAEEFDKDVTIDLNKRDSVIVKLNKGPDDTREGEAIFKTLKDEERFDYDIEVFQLQETQWGPVHTPAALKDYTIPTCI